MDHVTPLAVGAVVAVLVVVLVLAAVIAKTVNGRREMKISLRWLGLSLHINASNGSGRPVDEKGE